MRKLRLHCCTWNVGDQKSPDVDLSEFLGVSDKSHLPDVICIGLQEIIEDSTWTSYIDSFLQDYDYVLMKIRNLWAIWSIVYVLRKHLPGINNIESECTASGFAGVCGNKGAVTIRMDLYGINFASVSSHFTAHIENNKERLNDYMDIIQGQNFRDPDVELVLDHDYVFWMGDLNFRIEELNKEEIEKRITEGDVSSLWPHDQLNIMRKQNLIFCDFKEGDLNFPPTFKFDFGTDNYDTSKKRRKPAWTDRILYLCHEDVPNHREPHKPGLHIDLVKYTSLSKYKYSDHRPVVAVMEINVQDVGPPLPIFFQSPIGDITDTCEQDPEAVWSSHEDGEFVYHLHKHRDVKFQPDSWDYIALAPAKFKNLTDDFYTYIYVPTSTESKLESGVSAKFDKKYLEDLAGKEVVLIYVGKKNKCPQGYSRPFKIESDNNLSLQDMLRPSKTGIANMSRMLHSPGDGSQNSRRCDEV